MANQRINVYEGMFLFPQAAAMDLGAARDQVVNVLNRAGAEILSLQKWDERRLAYEIKGNKRGVYFHAYFKADAARIGGIERDCNLNEEMLRAMVLRADFVTPELIETAEGRAKLEDEIRLRRENPQPTRTETVSVGSGPDEDSSDESSDDDTE